jgi:predicted enzyme related to lactoylglutathione lyase
MTTLMMTKLVVADVEKQKAFYEAVCGVREVRRINAGAPGHTITELIMASNEPGGATLVLYQQHDEPAPAPGSCVLVFQTDDVDAFVERATAAGATVTTPAQKLPGLTYALLKDPEGHIVEPLKLDPAPAQ